MAPEPDGHLVEINGWRFQLDDEPNHYISKWVEITVSIHFETGWLRGNVRCISFPNRGGGFPSRLDKKDEKLHRILVK